MNKGIELNIQRFYKVNDGTNWLANEYMEDWVEFIGDDKGKSEEPIQRVTRTNQKLLNSS